MGRPFTGAGRLPGSKRLLAALLLALLLIGGAGAPIPARAVDRPDLNRALLATVRVAVPIQGQRDAYSTGSGTILSEEGLILTNFHVLGDVDRNTLYNRDGVAFIAVNPTNLRGLPTWLYEAEMVRASPALDLALLQITGYLESTDPLPESLGLVSIPLGDSEQVDIGDELSVIGFPGIGGDTVTFTQGRVSGFLDDNQDNVFDWIKTDAEVNHGNSGGLAIDAQGAMIGVPTAGVSDVEAAGKISLIRPINLALPLVRAGVIDQPTGNCRQAEQHPRGAAISNLVFARSVDRQGAPGGVAARFESGIETVYAVFDFDKFRNGPDFRFTWYLDDEQIFEDLASWQGGNRGSDWVNIYADGRLPEGTYRLELRYDEVLLGCGSFAIGTEPVTFAAPALGPIAFAAGQVDDEPVGVADAFDTGTREVYAFFDYDNMSDGIAWRQIWYVDGEIALDEADTWDAGASGNYWISVNARGALPDGDYELEIYVDGQLRQSGAFSIGQGASTPPIVQRQGVVVIGSVVDANRRSRPIPEAMVVFLNPDVRISRWLRSQSQDDIYAAGISDADGRFQLSQPVQPGQSYPVVVLATGYRPVSEQNYAIPADARSPFSLDVTMVAE